MESGTPDEKIIICEDKGSCRYVGLSRSAWYRTPSAGAEETVPYLRCYWRWWIATPGGDWDVLQAAEEAAVCLESQARVANLLRATAQQDATRETKDTQTT